MRLPSTAWALARLSAALLGGWLLLFSGMASAQVKPNDNPSPADIDQAKKHMASGVSFMQDPDGARYEEAYGEFRRAYELSGSMNALQNLGICAMHLELDGEAIEYFGIVLDKKGDDLDPADKTQLETDLGRLKSTVAWVTVTSDRPGTVVVDTRTPQRGDAIRNRYDVGLQQKRLGIHPGNHKLVATADGFPDQTWSTEIKPGQSYNHEFVFEKGGPVTAEGFTEKDMTGEEPKPDEEPEADTGGGGMPAYPFVVMGITLASGVVWGILAGVSASKKSTYDDEIFGRAPLDEQQSAADELKGINLGADITLGLTGALAVTTIILFVTAPTGEPEPEPEEAGGSRLRVLPLVDPKGGGGAVVTATF
jgi:hypothetical protein